jgi:hypothetical protein
MNWESCMNEKAKKKKIILLARSFNKFKFIQLIEIGDANSLCEIALFMSLLI